MEGITIDDIISEIVSSSTMKPKGASSAALDKEQLQGAILVDSWRALNSWVRYIGLW